MGRAPESEPIALAWGPPLYQVRITYPTPPPARPSSLRLPLPVQREDQWPAVRVGEGWELEAGIWAPQVPEAPCSFLHQAQFPIPLPSWALNQSAATLGTMFADLDYDIEEDKL